MSIAAATAVIEWGKTKINLIDTPGFSMFIHEAEMALPAVEAALVVVDAVSGVEVVTERIWQYCDKFALPRAIVCTRMDRERADFNRVMESLTSAFGRTVVPVQLPVGSEKSFTGVIDLVKMQAYTYEMGGNGKATVGPIPDNMAEQAKAAHERLVELVAEGDDSLMEEFFDKGTIAEEHIIGGLHNAIREDKIFPVLFASGLGNIGTDEVLDFIVDYLPTAVGARHRDRRSYGQQWRARHPQSQRLRAALALRLQDHQRSLLRTHLVLQGLLRRAEERRHGAELQPQQRRRSSPTFRSCRARPRFRSTSCTPATSAPSPS